MDLTLKCNVCLTESLDLVKAWETDVNNIKWSFKLNSCVAEVEWDEDYLLCQPCIRQLETAYAFRNLCLKSTAIRKKQWEYFKDEDKQSPEHDCYDCEEYVDTKTNTVQDSEESDDYKISGDVEHGTCRCKHCGVKFHNRKLLTLHNKDNHSSDRPYDCIYCTKSFKTSAHVEHHEKTHLNQNNYECDLCNTTYNTTSILRKHKIIKHTTPSEWKYLCTDCNTKYPFKSHRDAHVLRHHTNASDEYICFHCNESHPTKVLLISHIRTKHTNKKYTKRCNLCENVYINQIVLEDHMRKEHNVGTTKLKRRIKQYECTKCTKMYTTEKVMKNHYTNCDGIKRHNNDKNEQVKIEDDKNSMKLEPGDVITVEMKPPSEGTAGLEYLKDEEVKCKEEITNASTMKEKRPPSKRGRKKLDQISNACHICGMTFNTRYLAKRHIRNVHATEKNYECDVCQQKFASPVYLNAHKRYHSRERPHICSFCGKGFITGSDLYHHEKIHANKRAYKCDKCPKAFNTSSDLHKHKLCVHQDRNDWKYVCSYCNRRFPLKTNLDAHTKTHTGERNFACHLCDRRCVNRSVLLRHIKSHSNVRLFKCSLCSTEYKYQKSLDIHMTKVHGIGDAKIPERIKKYFCHICPKSYFANNKLQKHIRTHTGERPFSCQMCEKRFIDKSYVKQHLKTAHNVIFSETDVI